MRSTILLAMAAVIFCAVGTVYPNVSIAQDAVEENLESASPVVRNQHNRDRDMRNRQEGFRDRRGRTTEPPEDPLDQRESLNDDREDFNNRREDRQANREYYQDRKRRWIQSSKRLPGSQGLQARQPKRLLAPPWRPTLSTKRFPGSAPIQA